MSKSILTNSSENSGITMVNTTINPWSHQNYLLFCYKCLKNKVVCHPYTDENGNEAIKPETCSDCKLREAFDE